jgi:hypothetical protein
VTATTLCAEQTRLTGLGRSGGDAQERAATNPVAALPCTPTPLLHPLTNPLLIPLLIPPSATVGAATPDLARFGLVEGTDPGQSRAKTARDWPGSRGKLKQWRTTRARLHAGAFLSGRPPTNGVGRRPAASRGHHHHRRHRGWSDG